jgi:hypothetical protein
MCLSTLKELQNKIGIEKTSIDSMYKANKLTLCFELLAKTSMNAKVLNDAYSVVSLNV